MENRLPSVRGMGHLMVVMPFMVPLMLCFFASLTFLPNLSLTWELRGTTLRIRRAGRLIAETTRDQIYSVKQYPFGFEISFFTVANPRSRKASSLIPLDAHDIATLEVFLSIYPGLPFTKGPVGETEVAPEAQRLSMPLTVRNREAWDNFQRALPQLFKGGLRVMAVFAVAFLLYFLVLRFFGLGFEDPPVLQAAFLMLVLPPLMLLAIYHGDKYLPAHKARRTAWELTEDTLRIHDGPRVVAEIPKWHIHSVRHIADCFRLVARAGGRRGTKVYEIGPLHGEDAAAVLAFIATLPRPPVAFA